MRMGIAFRRRAMRGPARMTDAGESRQRLVVEQFHELVELARAAAAIDATAVQRSDARGIIAAIFQTLERIHDQGRHVARSGNADDATHDSTVPVLAGLAF